MPQHKIVTEGQQWGRAHRCHTVQPHSRLCQLCRACEQQRSCTPGFRRKELHATEGALSRSAELGEIRGRRHRRARWTFHSGQRWLRYGVKPYGTRAHEPRSCTVAVLAARRGTVCGEVGRVPGFPQLTVHTLYPPPPPTKHARSQRSSIGVALSPGPVSSTKRAPPCSLGLPARVPRTTPEP